MEEIGRTGKILVQLEISVFKIPPCQDVMAIGKNTPMGKHAAMKMLEPVAPNMFEMIEVDSPVIEALIVKKAFVKLMGRDRLTNFIVEKVEPLMEDNTILNIGLNARLLKTGTLEVKDD